MYMYNSILSVHDIFRLDLYSAMVWIPSGDEMLVLEIANVNLATGKLISEISFSVIRISVEAIKHIKLIFRSSSMVVPMRASRIPFHGVEIGGVNSIYIDKRIITNPFVL